MIDTLKTMECYCDGIIIRSPNHEILSDYQNEIDIKMINGGDKFEHPTQALVDLFTIRQELGTVNNLKIAIVGDLYHSRTIISLVKMLLNYNVTFYFVFENKKLFHKYLTDFLIKMKAEADNTFNHKINYYYEDDLDKVIPLVDVIYMTRSQKERHDKEIKIKNKLTVNNFSKAKEKCIILHPLPRNEELDPKLDCDPRSVYFRQMKYGLYVRMALLEMMFN